VVRLCGARKLPSTTHAISNVHVVACSVGIVAGLWPGTEEPGVGSEL
jgi:hypothetical protein